MSQTEIILKDKIDYSEQINKIIDNLKVKRNI